MNSDDFNQLIGVFIAETQEFLQLLETNLLAMESGGTGETRLQLVKEMFRAAHSIKGSARMFGFETLAQAAHALEDCFAILRDKADLSHLDRETVTALLRGVDCLRRIAGTIQVGAKPPGDSLPVLPGNSSPAGSPLPPSESAEASENMDSEPYLAISQLKAELEAKYGKKEPPQTSVAAGSSIAPVIQAIFERDLPPVLNRLETEISQVLPETLEQTVRAVSEIYYQLSGVAGMLNLPEYGQIAERLRSLIQTPDLSAELLQTSGREIALCLQVAREQVCAGEPIVVARSVIEKGGSEEFSDRSEIGNEELRENTDSFLSADNYSVTESASAEFRGGEELLRTDSAGESEMPAQMQRPTRAGVPVPVEARPTIRVDLERLTELINLVGELVINRTNLELQESQLRNEVRRIRRKILDLNQYGSQLREEYDRLAGSGVRGTVGAGPRACPSPAGGNRTPLDIPAPSAPLPVTAFFDPLEMDEYTEFHSTAGEVIETTQAIAQSASKIDELATKFERSTDHLRRICDDLRARVMQLRVVPFSRAVDHLPRAVRDLCHTHHKQVNLLLFGRDTKIDESLLDALRDPLVHLVRNAFDHGIEPPSVRKAAGKPATGQIEIEARHQGGKTIITVSDDGRGIDPEAIRLRIVQNNYITPEQARDLSSAELYEFLFWPGLTTAGDVTELSGRGVGLDVVRTNLRLVRGTVKVDSRVGKGTSFILKLPLMLSIADALLVRTDRNTVAVPLDAVEEILHLEGHQIHMAGTQPMLRWRGEFIRLVRLQELVKYSIPHPDGPSPDPIAQDHIPVIVLASSEGILATAVERLVGQQEIVVKPLPAPLSKPHGILGCTILGDGRAVSILDVDDLIGQFQTRTLGARHQAPPQIPANAPSPGAIPIPQSPNPGSQSLQPSWLPAQILVVDDSYTIRQMLALTLNRARYRVVHAKDGQEALEKLQSGLDCSLVIADIEMPRMDGFELLRAIKSDSQLASLPVAMLTSRSGAKHRQTALELGASHYFTKPYSEAQLLQVVSQLLEAHG
ncbi:MAG: hybrid sensor histidine kinase/response regulator [Oscillatoria princeps RMCB-10]|jgi:chemosensory pili system protein ChpA (sensor histidine kinase/response regulator)|nr:hybrid sensor histidine kinase/response regulator [Oscillatoria princeps RMCB-10]